MLIKFCKLTRGIAFSNINVVFFKGIEILF